MQAQAFKQQCAVRWKVLGVSVFRVWINYVFIIHHCICVMPYCCNSHLVTRVCCYKSDEDSVVEERGWLAYVSESCVRRASCIRSLWEGLLSVIAVFTRSFLSYCTFCTIFGIFKWHMRLLHCTLSLAAQCIVISPVFGRVCNGRTACVCGSVTMITRNCVRRSSPNWVCM